MSFFLQDKSWYKGETPDEDTICKHVYCARNGNPEDCVRELASFSDGIPCAVGKVYK